MNELKVFTNANFGEIRTVSISGQLPPLTLTSFAKKWGLVTIR